MLNLFHLDERTRSIMQDELTFDLDHHTLYISSRLTELGRQQWESLLRLAMESGSDASLANDLRRHGLLNTHEPRRTSNGGMTNARVPVTAPDTLAEGEFNRFYMRALCRRALEEDVQNLVIYRAKEVSQPRWESEAKIDQLIDPQRLLDDLRARPGVDTALGLPPGPNSGLSIRFPGDQV